jgi:hypothetical protein
MAQKAGFTFLIDDFWATVEGGQKGSGNRTGEGVFI